MSGKRPRTTEVDAYLFIRDNLRELGWDVRDPERVATGQVWTQNECLGNPEIRRLLGQKRPENIVKVTERILWVIEAKRSQRELDGALADAKTRADILNTSNRFKVQLLSGVAGNSTDGFLVRSRFLHHGDFKPITWNGVDITALLSPAQADEIIRNSSPNIEDPVIDERHFLSRANAINEILHLGAVNPHQRAGVMAALLLSMLSDTGPNVEERSPTILIGDINSRVKNVLDSQGKPEFYNHVKIALPAATDNHTKFRQALVDTIQELYKLNIKSAINSGADWLGTFYEVFLKYASWAQDLGIVLTPRHLTQWAAEVMDIHVSDIVYDPTCGTGGFLVAAFDYVKRRANENQINKFKQNCLFGVEQESGVAALAVVNMIFRGDGNNNIKEGNCFAQYLAPAINTSDGTTTAQYVRVKSDTPPVTKVMMNPPFALKRSAEKEYKFIEQALGQMEEGGILFSVLPYSAMCKPKGYDTWRKGSLLARHTLLAVVTFPIDIFYPIGVTTCGIFIRKGIPHPHDQRVLWIRAPSDGLLKSKGKRLPNDRASNELFDAVDMLRAFLRDQDYPIRSVEQFCIACPVDFTDRQVELVPEVFLDQAEPAADEVFDTLEEDLRDVLAYLIRIRRARMEPDLLRLSGRRTVRFGTPRWRMFHITDFFDLKRGNFHSLAALDSGAYPTISRVSTDNGCVGFFDKPDGAVLWPAGTITVSSVTGDAFIQPVPFIATDNVVLCTLKDEHAGLSLPALFFIQAMMNHIRWRYSYGRQCYKTKYAKTQIPLPVTINETLDEKFITDMVIKANYWRVVEASFERC